jgi:hypothetical protein
MSETRAPVAIHLKKATGAVEISEPEGRLTLLDRRLFNHLLAHAYRDLGKRSQHMVRLSVSGAPRPSDWRVDVQRG